MKVILTEDVKALGKKGDIVEVNDGYARNFILKTKKGIEANAKNMNDLKLKRQNDDKVALEQLEAAKELAKKLGEGQVKLAIKKKVGDVILAGSFIVSGICYAKAIKVGKDGRAFGSVSSKEIAAAVKAQMNLEVDKKKIQLKDALKTLGTHMVPVKVHPKVTAELKVVVTEEA